MVLRDLLQTLIRNNVFGEFHKKICNNGFVLYLILISESPDGEMVEASLDTLMLRSGWSLGKVYACLDRLEEAGLIRRTLPGKPGVAQVYKIQRPRISSSGKVVLKNPPAVGLQGNGVQLSKELRDQILKRDQYCCVLKDCHKTKDLHIHHIDDDNRNNSEKNLVTLCSGCHGKTKKDRVKWRKFFETWVSNLYRPENTSKTEEDSK